MMHTRVVKMKNVLRLSLLMCFGILACSPHKLARAQTLSITHPDDPGKRVEYFLEKPNGSGPWPTIVFIHGHQDWPRAGGKDFVKWGVLDEYADRGYLAIAVSQPGYGGSSGSADFCGPFTQHAVEAVLNKVRAQGYVQDNKVVLEGVSRGAIVAGLMATHDPGIKAVVLISGVYDLTEYSKRASNPIARSVVASIQTETGGSADALKMRSLLSFAQEVHANTLILNGAQDDRTDPDQALRLAASINAHGGRAKAIVYPQYGHQIPVQVRNRDIEPFIDEALSR